MHFTTLVVDENFRNYKDELFKLSKQNENITIIYSGSFEDVQNKILLNSVDLLIISDDLYQNKFDSFLKELSIFKILISKSPNDNDVVNKFSELNIFDFISQPVNPTKLFNKISLYNNINENNRSLQREKNFTNLVVNFAPSPICVYDGENIIFSNDAFLKLFDIKNIDEYNKDKENITKKYFNQEIYSDWIKNLIEAPTQRVEIFKGDKKLIFNIQQNYCSLDHNHVVLLDDITKEIEHQTELVNLLYTDNLTKLPNRAKLIDDLKTNRIDIQSISIVDLNSFKEINDFYGNYIGDQILKGIATLILEAIEPYETIHLYKFHADTYCVVNTVKNEEEFTKISASIIDKIDKKVFYYDQNEIDTRATAGISFSSKNNKLITADLALQAAKRDHKDYLVFYDELDNLKEYENNMLWTKKLKNALANDDIIVYYQPLINNETLRVEKYECLVRMIDGDRIISPFFFLDVSKKSNQYTKITKTVIEKSFKEFQHLPFEFSVNVSYEDIEDETFLEFIKTTLNKYDVAKKVVFEILEDEGIKRYDVLINFIDEVKKLGCKIAIDDFGSGYSNFEHLLKMNVDFLKIDASLVKNIASDKNSYKITKTIIEFAKSLNLKTIAEYVENKEIFELVKELGADYSQGYYFSAPIACPNIYTAVNKVIR